MSKHHAVLNVSPDASPEEIKRAYRELVSVHHPDKGGSSEKFIEVRAAYKALMDGQDETEESLLKSGWKHWRDTVRPFSSYRCSATISLRDAYTGCTVRHQETNTELKVSPGASQKVYSFSSGDTAHIELDVRIKPHDFYERRGSDLYTIATVNILLCIAGGPINVKTIDDQVIQVQVPKLTSDGTVLRLVGKGMPIEFSNGAHGNLYLTIRHQMPTTLSDVARLKILQAMG